MNFKKPNRSELDLLVNQILGIKPSRIAALPSNARGRHWNFRVSAGTSHYLLRIENPLAVLERRMRLGDEANIVRFFGAHGLAPKFIHFGRHRGRRVLVEEWLHGRRLPLRLARRHLTKLAEFFARMSGVPRRSPVLRIAWKTDSLNDPARRRILESRLRAARRVSAFRGIIQEITPTLRAGYKELRRRVSTLPKVVLAKLVFVYRDISPSNILMTSPHYRAVDWEWHSVGLADPSFSLAVLIWRFKLSPQAQTFVIRAYHRRRPTPNLRKLIQARLLERHLGGLVWGISWVARKSRLDFPRSVIARDIRAAIRSTREEAQIVRKLLAP